jgi:hypothetical protein
MVKCDMKRVLFFLVLLLASCSPATQSLSDVSLREVLTGTWDGVLTQPDLPDRPPNLTFSMDLTLEENSVVGTSRLSSGSLFGQLSLEGQISNNTFSFQEKELLEASPGTFWCVKQGVLTLELSGGVPTLVGNWVDPNCQSGSPDYGGTVRLQKR